MLHSELKAARESLHISQAEMADRLTISRHTYMRWESGVTNRLPEDLAARVAQCIAGKATQLLERGDDMLEVNAGTYRKWYTKVSKNGFEPNDKHPTGCSGRLPREYLEAFERGDMTTWQEYLDLQKAQAHAEWVARDDADNAAYLAELDRKAAAFPTLEEALGHYETTGEDDLATERRIQNFFQNQG